MWVAKADTQQTNSAGGEMCTEAELTQTGFWEGEAIFLQVALKGSDHKFFHLNRSGYKT